MIIISFILVAVVSIYTLWLVILSFAWAKNEPAFKLVNDVPASIIVPFRNEVSNLKNCIESLLNQNYNSDKFEIILVNDHSTDGSTDCIKNYPNIKLVNLKEDQFGKKQAINHGIENSNFELILTIDADTIADKNLLRNIISKQTNLNSQMVIGMVKLEGNNNFSSAIQILEHFALTIVGGGSAKINSPIMCNGANLLFKKSAFTKVGGYSGNENIASGDDVFLMNKINKEFTGQISYLKKDDSLVKCTVEPTFSSTIIQRIRWAKKNKSNTNQLNALTAILVVFSNFSWPILGLLSVFNGQLTKYFLFSLLLKCIIDFLLLFLASSFYKQRKWLWWFPMFFCFYPFELIIIIISSLVVKQKWKERIIN